MVLLGSAIAVKLWRVLGSETFSQPGSMGREAGFEEHLEIPGYTFYSENKSNHSTRFYTTENNVKCTTFNT